MVDIPKNQIIFLGCLRNLQCLAELVGEIHPIKIIKANQVGVTQINLNFLFSFFFGSDVTNSSFFSKNCAFFVKTKVN
jgi:hypothetical protein